MSLVAGGWARAVGPSGDRPNMDMAREHHMLFYSILN